MLDDKSRRVSIAPKFPEMKEPTKLDSNILLKMTTEFFERVKDTGKWRSTAFCNRNITVNAF